VDLVEDAGGSLHGFEIKWSRGPAKAPALWSATYPAAGFDVISRDKYLPFIT
jgi:hypothetical protein